MIPEMFHAGPGLGRLSDVTIIHGDCLDAMAELAADSVDAIVTDPPYGLEFMGKEWDKFGGAPARFRDATAADGKTNGITRGSMPDAYRAGPAFQEWATLWCVEALRVLKPGGHLLAFGGTRTWHRLAVAVEDAGFEIRDSIAWLYGSGFPKSLDVSKAIDKAARGVPQGGADPTSPNHGNYRTTKTEGKRWDGDSGQGYGAGGSQFLATDGRASGSATAPAVSGVVETAAEWSGWGTALKPAFEPIVVARKPLSGTVAANVLEHGTGALNIDATRIAHGADVDLSREQRQSSETSLMGGLGNGHKAGHVQPLYAKGGRWPANVVLDADQAAALDQQSGNLGWSSATVRSHSARPEQVAKGAERKRTTIGGHNDTGGASRFFYCAKAPKRERPVVDGVAHPTVKPLSLMRWLVRLVTPPGGTVLDPFAGSGTTVEAALLEDFRVIGIEREVDYLAMIQQRIVRSLDV